MNNRYEIRFAGSGGQGNILAAVITARAAAVFGKGLYVAQTQTYGAEARGGKSQAQVIISRSFLQTFRSFLLSRPVNMWVIL
jgi:2-oxoglutarate ferredoxin oxidoreductase subunit gamma